MAEINKDRFVSFPKELFVAVLKQNATPDTVTAALVDAGIEETRFDFLQGEEGLRILNPRGDHGSVRERMLRKAENFAAEGRILGMAADYLRDGRTMVGIHDVPADEADELKAMSDALGLEDCHYLGKRRID